MVVMLHQDCINGRRLRRVTWEEAQEGDLWLSCCIRTGRRLRRVTCGCHGRRLRRVTCGCHVASGLHQWEEAQEGDLWLSCCIRTASMGEAQEGDLWLSASMGGGSGG